MIGGHTLRADFGVSTAPQPRGAELRARPARPVRQEVVKIGPVEIDLESRIVRRAGHVIHLSRLEFDLLVLLASPLSMVNARDDLMAQLWPGRPVSDSRTLDTHIRRLRLKLETDPARPRHLITVRGVGFRIDP